MTREAISDKLIVVGIDGMDPCLTRKYMARGVMPNVEKLMKHGSYREDLVLMGAQPTITPPCWTTLSTGAYPATHGITCFKKQGNDIADLVYGMGSDSCKAEQLWDCFVDAGKKTLVCQWPGASWPPTKEDANLMVIDGTQPTFINMLPIIDSEEVIIADVKTDEITFKPMAASDGNVPCVVKDLEEVEVGAALRDGGHLTHTILILKPEDGEHALSEAPYNIAFSPIKDASGWIFAPDDAKEFIALFNYGFLRRPCLILKNEAGIYDHVSIYKNKKSTEPIVTLYKDQFTRDIWDEVIDGDSPKPATRDMLLLEIAEDGTHIEMYATGAGKPDNDNHFYPKALYHELTEKIGPIPTMGNISGKSKKLIGECHLGAWEHEADWQAAAIHYLIETKDVEVVFSHYHNVDAMGHQIMKYLKQRDFSPMSAEDYDDLMQMVYEQADRYIGRYMDLLDNGWTVALVSDHGQVCPEHEPHLMGDGTGVNIRVMADLGFTTMKKDADGNELYEIDWEKTIAVAPRGNHIYLNIKGRNQHEVKDADGNITIIDGLIDPADQYEVEEQIMTALYNYKDEKTGNRIFALALRNKDAMLLGLGGPDSGDIIYFMAEGYNIDHGCCLSTTQGCAETSVSPLCVLAGKGFKKNFVTDRIIRQVDIAPTLAYLGGVRMPAQCEGSILYQILENEF